MTTTLDIIDTIVKIGLGASIAGLTSYMLAKRNNNHEIRKNSMKEQKDLIKDLAIKLEKVDSIINEVALFFHKNEIELAKEALIPATQEISSAAAYSNLLSEDRLITLIHSMSDAIDHIYFELLKESPENNQLDKMQKKFIEHKKLAYPYIRNLYNANY